MIERLLEIWSKKFSAGTPVQELQGCLDFVQVSIVKLLQDDSFVRFKETSLYRLYLQGAPLPEISRPAHSRSSDFYESTTRVEGDLTRDQQQQQQQQQQHPISPPSDDGNDSYDPGLKRLLNGFEDGKRLSPHQIELEAPSSNGSNHGDMNLHISTRDSGDTKLEAINEKRPDISTSRASLGLVLPEISLEKRRSLSNYYPNQLADPEQRNSFEYTDIQLNVPGIPKSLRTPRLTTKNQIEPA